MPRVVTFNALGKWSSIFHFGSSRCYESEGSPNALAESHSICSVAGAIFVENTFTQFDGTLSIINSSAEQQGGAVHLGASFRESFEMLLELWFIIDCDSEVSVEFDAFECCNI